MKKAAKKSSSRKRVSRKRSSTRERSVRSSGTPQSGGRPWLADDEVELALATGQHQAQLENLFGPEEYAELRELAQEASRVQLRNSQKVIILPGIMGSKLGSKRTLLPGWDELWVDFLEMIDGKLVDLSLESERNLQPCGVILLTYLKLKFRLRREGFNAVFYPYDWRQSIDKLGRDFARYLEKEERPVSLVAHSMGGLVSRSALATLGEKGSIVQKLVMLGTPNHGSYSPVQVFRGASKTVRNLAKITPQSVEELVDEALGTLDGLIQMMPFLTTRSGVDFFKPSSWPEGKLKPKTGRLRSGPRVQKHLDKVRPEDLARCYLIAGVNRETVVDAVFEDGEYKYSYSNEGDGTVPLEFAKLDGIQETYFIDEQHGSLPNNRTVSKAVADILRTGQTKALKARWNPSRQQGLREVSDEELRQIPIELEEQREPGTRDRQEFLSEFLSTSRESRVSSTDEDSFPELKALSEQQVVIGRRTQQVLDVTLAKGDVTDVNTQAIILGVYQGVRPTAAARALDEALDGEISKVTARGLFSAESGEVFVLPVSRRRISVDFVVFVGLGFYDEFTEEVLRMASRNTARILLAAQISEFATVMMGSGSASSIRGSLKHMLLGFTDGITESEGREKIRSVTIVEFDEKRYAQMTRAVIDLSVSRFLDDIEVAIDCTELQRTFVRRRMRAAVAERGSDPTYLIVRQDSQGIDLEKQNENQTIHASVLTSGGKATVISEAKHFTGNALNEILADVGAPGQSKEEVKALGRDLMNLVLPEAVREVLWQQKSAGLPVVVLHDERASRIPWELMTLESFSGPEEFVPALEAGMSRKLMTQVPVAKWMEERIKSRKLKILLVVDPTSDLPGAVKEGDRILELVSSMPKIEVKELRKHEATHGKLLTEFRSGEYDVIHYAGHAFFDPVNRSRSGLLCSDRRVLSGQDLAGIGELPSLLFFNACESGRVRNQNPTAIAAPEAMTPDIGEEAVLRNVSLSEAFLKGGVANIIGTYWPVGDDPAKVFAEVFYQELLEGAPIGEALHKGRIKVSELPSRDWADYMHYGDRYFRLKE